MPRRRQGRKNRSLTVAAQLGPPMGSQGGAGGFASPCVEMSFDATDGSYLQTLELSRNREGAVFQGQATKKRWPAPRESSQPSKKSTECNTTSEAALFVSQRSYRVHLRRS